LQGVLQCLVDQVLAARRVLLEGAAERLQMYAQVLGETARQAPDVELWRCGAGRRR
jgi:hypothetical protein